MKRSELFDMWCIYNTMWTIALIISYLILIPVIFNQLTFEVFIGFFIGFNLLFLVLIFSFEIIYFLKNYKMKIIKKEVNKIDDM